MQYVAVGYILHVILYFCFLPLVGTSVDYGWGLSYSSQTTRSPMPSGSMHCTRDFKLFGNAAYHEFCKPCVSS